MSFSNDVREEIARSITDRDRQFACLYGILLYSRIFTQEQVVLQSESPVFARLMPMLFRAVFRTELQPDVRTISRGGDQSMVSYTITDAAQISRICEVYHIRPEKREIRLSNLVNNSLSAFLAGVFFGCGSMWNSTRRRNCSAPTCKSCWGASASAAVSCCGKTCTCCT